MPVTNKVGTWEFRFHADCQVFLEDFSSASDNPLKAYTLVAPVFSSERRSWFLQPNYRCQSEAGHCMLDAASNLCNRVDRLVWLKTLLFSFLGQSLLPLCTVESSFSFGIRVG
uniref:Uncharacterized protein n=1 Tax=Arundo donax TaxID=35708 RepID=A0A0A9FP79_ARUDO